MQSDGDYPDSLRYYAQTEERFAALHYSSWQASTLVAWSSALEQQGVYDQELEKLQKALPLLEQRVGPADLRVSDLFQRLGQSAKQLGMHNDAADFYNRTAHILEQHRDQLGDFHLRMGELLLRAGNKAAALEHLQRAVDDARDRRTTKHGQARRGLALAQLGAAQRELRVMADAQTSYHAAIEQLTIADANPNAMLAATWFNLGTLQAERGTSTMPAESLSRALDMRYKLYGGSDWSVVEALQQRAEVEYRQNKLDAARSDLRDAVRIGELLGGPLHLNVAACHSMLAEISLTKGDSYTALEQALAEQKR